MTAMSEHANIDYTGVADRNARRAFEQAAADVTSLKRAVSDIEGRLAANGSGASGVSDVAASVSSIDMRAAYPGAMFLTFAFAADLDGSGAYETAFKLKRNFPRSAVAGAVSYLSSPPASGYVTCAVLADGTVKIGKNGTGGATDCVASVAWRV